MSTIFNVIHIFSNKKVELQTVAPQKSISSFRNQRSNLRQFILGNIFPLQQRGKQTDDLGLVAMAENSCCKIFLTGKGGRKGATKGLGALDIADFPDSTLAQ